MGNASVSIKTFNSYLPLASPRFSLFFLMNLMNFPAFFLSFLYFQALIKNKVKAIELNSKEEIRNMVKKKTKESIYCLSFFYSFSLLFLAFFLLNFSEMFVRHFYQPLHCCLLFLLSPPFYCCFSYFPLVEFLNN